MIKYFFVGLWITIVALGSTFGAATFMSASKQEAAAAKAKAEAEVESQKTRVLNVPMIRQGVVGGYISVQFVYTTVKGATKDLAVSPEVYLLDDAFRLIYADDSFDFHHLERYDLAKLTKSLVSDTNAKLGEPVIKDILISDMNYTPKDQANRTTPPPEAAQANEGGGEAPKQESN